MRCWTWGVGHVRIKDLSMGMLMRRGFEKDHWHGHEGGHGHADEGGHGHAFEKEHWQRRLWWPFVLLWWECKQPEKPAAFKPSLSIHRHHQIVHMFICFYQIVIKLFMCFIKLSSNCSYMFLSNCRSFDEKRRPVDPFCLLSTVQSPVSRAPLRARLKFNLFSSTNVYLLMKM